MNTQELKELAEWAAEWLGGKKVAYGNPKSWSIKYGHGKYLSVSQKDDCYDFFRNPEIAPILAALAKRKMDQDENITYECGSIRVDGVLIKTCSIYINLPDDEIRRSDENEYIALWLAIRNAIRNAIGEVERLRDGVQ